MAAVLESIYVDGTTINSGDIRIYSTSTADNGNYTYTISDPEYVGDWQPAPEFQILSPEQSALNNIIERLQEFKQWLQEEQCDLEEECGADLSGLIDKLEETFPELSGEAETDDGLGDDGRILNTDQYIDHLRRSLVEILQVDPRDVGLDVGYGSNLEDFIGRRENED